MNRSIAVIGGGASAIAFLNTYIAQFGAIKALPDSVYIFEKTGTFGPGVAYENDLDTNLLNTKTGFITPFYDRPGDFHSWLSNYSGEWRRQFPKFVVDADSYAPRPLFGLYLRSRFNWLVKRAAGCGIRVIQIHAEVVDVFPVGRSYGVVTSCNVTVHADHVVLAVGTIQRGGGEKNEEERLIFSNPYPLGALTESVRKEASIAILGARLSCIDTVIGLISQGHSGPITIHSRSGYFPSVRGTQGRLAPKVFNVEAVRALTRQPSGSSLDALAELFNAELSVHGAPPISIAELRPPEDLASFLRSEIAAAKYPRLWQAVLYATNGFIEELWAALPGVDQRRLMTELFSVFMSYRVSFPPENADLILRYVEDGQVNFIAGKFSLSQEAGRNTVVMADGKMHEYDCVIWATGAPRSIDDLDSQLIKNLSSRGMIAPHAMGGIQVDPLGNRVIESSGNISTSLRAIGELTNGQFFFTSAIEILVRQAKRCVEALVQDVNTARNNTTDPNDVLSMPAVVAC